MRVRLDLRGRNVVVTGGARGIGLQVARAAAARGARPALIDVDGELAAAMAAEIGGIGVRADVTQLAELEATVDEIADRLGGIDVLVANAGIGPVATTVDAGDRVHQRRVLDVNLHGVWHTVWAGGRHVADRRGHVVIVSSIAAFAPVPSWAAYGASKAAVEQLGRSMRVELAPTGTTVGVAHFGLVDTALVRAFEQDPVAARLERLGAGRMRRVTAEAAAEAVVAGIERRAPRTVYPPRWRVLYGLRGVIGPLADAVLTRDPRARAVMTTVRERDHANQEERHR